MERRPSTSRPPIQPGPWTQEFRRHSSWICNIFFFPAIARGLLRSISSRGSRRRFEGFLVTDSEPLDAFFNHSTGFPFPRGPFVPLREQPEVSHWLGTK